MSKKFRILIWSIILDGIGMLSFILPIVGEFFDIVWAPASAYIAYKMYKGTMGKIGGVISFIEESGIFGTDFFPTFTLLWIYTYVIQKK